MIAMSFILAVVGGLIIFSFYLSMTILIPLAILIFVDYLLFTKGISRLFKNKSLSFLGVFLSLVIITPTVFVGYVSLKSFKSFWFSEHPQMTKLDRKHQEQANGVLSFAADLYNRNAPTQYFTIDKKGNLVKEYDAYIENCLTKDGKPKNKNVFSYKITNLIYFGGENEPCGFQIDVTNWQNQKGTWQFHYPKEGFHNSSNIRVVPSDDFNAVVKIYNSKNEKVTSFISEKAFCMDIVK